jgi:peptidoglycan/LPS O-acetylase OafA/YrhL
MGAAGIQGPRLSVGFSAFLDFVRFGAAIVVFLSHFGTQAISHSVFYVFDYFAHSAVIVFFVLSGYVIAYVTEERERDGLAYAVSRFCRIYSVVVPAVVLTVVLDIVGRSIDPDLYSAYSYFGTRFGLIQALSSLLFLNETWPTPINLFSNTAYWSLNYEVWYYVFFGILMLWHSRWKWPLLLLLSPFVAARIYLLAPVWLLGVWVRRQERTVTVAKPWCALILGACFAAVLAGDWLTHRTALIAQLPSAENLIGVALPLWDYMTGLLVALAFLAAAGLTRRWVPSRPLLLTIRWLAGMTFSIYLFHRPLLLFLSAVLPGEVTSNARRLAILGISALTLVALSYVTERQKDRLKAKILCLLALLQHTKIGRRLRPS